MEQELLARSQVYRLLSAALSFPDETTWKWLCGDESRRALETVAGERGGLDALLEMFSDSGRERFLAEHTALFGFTAGGELLPYEAPYGAGNMFQEADCMADIAGFYRAFGLESAESCPERPDHIAVELEFMHFLAVKEMHALSNGSPVNAQVCREAQKLFLKDHIGRWAPFFLRRVATRATSRAFDYLANAAAAWIVADCHRFDVAIPTEEPVVASFDSLRAGENFSCGINSCGAELCGSQTTMPRAPVEDTGSDPKMAR